MIPLACWQGYSLGSAHAQDPNSLGSRIENAWRACSFPTNSVLGKREDVAREIEEHADSITVMEIEAEDVPFVLQHFNTLPPASTFEADSMYLVQRGPFVWLHFVKNDCVYYYQKMTEVQWRQFLRQAHALKGQSV
jgi:hypothetical protein